MSFFENTRKPVGLGGKIMVAMMNVGHSAVARWGLQFLNAAPDAKVLDCGCGGGANMKRLLKKCPQGVVKGIDYSPVSVEKSKKVNEAAITEGRCAVLQGSVADMMFADNWFDAVTAFETVYFWPDLLQCFREVYRALKPGGTFLICNESNGDTDKDERWTKLIGGMTIYKDTQLKAYLEQAGFHEVQIHKKKSWLCITARKGGRSRQMKDKKLLFDRSCHVLYSKPCKKEIRAKIALHYPEAEQEAIWEQVQRQYADFLSDWRTDLGGKRNFHNGVGGTYDCIAIMSYYVVCKAVTSFREIEEMEENLILPIFRRLRFVDCNKPFWRKLMYRAFVRAKSGCDKWHDYEMSVAPYETDKPIYYEFTSCPAAEFAIRHGLTDIMPALCNVDYASMELLHARLVRTTTCVDGCRCDYTICGDKDPYLKGHPEYRDEAGYRRNK